MTKKVVCPMCWAQNVNIYGSRVTVYSLLLQNSLPESCLDQVRAMCAILYPANINIDYFPTNFVLQDGRLYYIDYECNDYMEQWDLEHWGIKYWSRTPEFLQYVK